MRLKAFGMVLALAAWPRLASCTETCTNGVDDDADGLRDCDDGDCRLDVACQLRVTIDVNQLPYPLYPALTAAGNRAYISWPDIPVIADDAGGSPSSPYCVGWPGAPSRGDGVIDCDDVLCTFWRAPIAGDSIGLWRARGERQPYGRSLVFVGGRILGVGDRFPISGREGYRLMASPTPGNAVGTLAGACDPAATDVTIAYPPPQSPLDPPETYALVYLHLRWGGPVDEADEVLCGLRGTDWQDADGDGAPDTCTNGLFDGATPLTVATFDYDTSTSNATDGHMIARTVRLTDRGLGFAGTDFALRDGDAVEVEMYQGQQPRTFHDTPARCP
jgi:hypothetical protein